MTVSLNCLHGKIDSFLNFFVASRMLAANRYQAIGPVIFHTVIQ